MKAHELINAAHLHRGACRESIIKTLLESKHALSESEIKDKMEGKFDRTSVYRTFKTLIESQVLHQIVIDKGLIKYAVNHQQHSMIQHAHFYCTECGKVVCVEPRIPISKEEQLPHSFTVKSAEIIYKGTCNQCNSLQ